MLTAAAVAATRDKYYSHHVRKVFLSCQLISSEVAIADSYFAGVYASECVRAHPRTSKKNGLGFLCVRLWGNLVKPAA